MIEFKKKVKTSFSLTNLLSLKEENSNNDQFKEIENEVNIFLLPTKLEANQ